MSLPFQSGGLISLLKILASTNEPMPVREKAASLVMLCVAKQEGDELSKTLFNKLLASHFEDMLDSPPSKIVQYFDQDHEGEDHPWGNHQRAELRKFLYETSKKLRDTAVRSECQDWRRLLFLFLSPLLM